MSVPQKYEITARIIGGGAPREITVIEWAYDVKDALMQSTLTIGNEIKTVERIDKYLRIGPPVSEIMAIEQTSKAFAESMSALIGKVAEVRSGRKSKSV